MEKKKTLVIGASGNPSRYSNMAIRKLRSHGHPVVAVGLKPAQVEDVNVINEKKPETGIDTVTLYLNPANQKDYYDYILSLHPNRIIFNPGTENEELATLAKENNIKSMEACTLVLLSTGQY